MPKRFIRILIIFYAIIMSCGSPEAYDYDHLLVSANQSLKRGLYDEALENYSKLKESKQHYNKAIKGIIEVYQQRNQTDQLLTLLSREKQNNQSSFLLSALGGLYKQSGDLDNALVYYQEYLDQLPDGSKNVSKVNQIIGDLEFAIDLINNPYDINVRELDAPINSAHSEYSPSFTIDEERLIFTREVNGQEDLYEAVLTTDGYEVNSIDEVNTKYNEGAQTISGNGQRLVFTHCNENFGFGSCDLYESIRMNGQWAAPSNLGPKINGPTWESQPSLNTDGTRLYFSSNRTGGLGGSDIWVSTIDTSGTWSKPKNLGKGVNTSRNERTPFIHPDGRTLYFSSDGLRSIGGYDLYMSQFRDGEWSDPKNCGSPINTVYDDHNLIVSTDGMRAYYSRESDTNGDRNIYEITLPEVLKPSPITYVQLTILDEVSLEPLTASVELVDLVSEEPLESLTTVANGSILTTLPLGKNVSIHIESEGYLFHSENIYYSEVRYGQDPYLDTIYLSKLSGEVISESENPTIILNNIFFDSGSSDIKPESAVEIGYIYELLINDPEISVAIIGHTDNVGSPNDNLELSLNRAVAIRDELLAMGIDPSRIQTIGKGETEPIAENNSEQGRAKNRRTELMINR